MLVVAVVALVAEVVAVAVAVAMVGTDQKPHSFLLLLVRACQFRVQGSLFVVVLFFELPRFVWFPNRDHIGMKQGG